MTPISLASKQIWPQVLAVLHLRPQRLVLVHSAEESESKRPAERLRAMLETMDKGLQSALARTLGTWFLPTVSIL